MASYIFRSTDTGAPQLANNTPGQVIAVLKAVLINGYDVKSPLGWSVEYEDAPSNQIVFRAPEGTRFPISITDNNSTVGCALAIAYESVSSIVKGILPCPLASETANKYIRWGHSTYSVNNPWIIIGDTKGFYFFIQDRYGQYGNIVPFRMHYIGDYTTYHAGNIDTYNFVTHLEQNSTSYYWYITAGSVYPWIMRNPYTYARDAYKADTWSASWSVTRQGIGMFSNIEGFPIAGSKVYQPIQLQLQDDPVKFVGQYPGLLEPIDPGDTNNGYGTALDPHYEVAGNERALMIPIGYSSTYNRETSCGRVAVIVGEGFRNVL